jgi:hypothetical protein
MNALRQIILLFCEPSELIHEIVQNFFGDQHDERRYIWNRRIRKLSKEGAIKTIRTIHNEERQLSRIQSDIPYIPVVGAWLKMGSEQELTSYLVLNPPIKQFPIVFRNQWEVVPGHCHLGEGDLVFTNVDSSEFLVIEVKFLKKKRLGYREKSIKVVKQALRYANAIFEETKKRTWGYTFTNVKGLQQICLFE